jgi:hypothetical protein
MPLIEQTIDAASANANNRNGFASDCSEAAQLMRAEAEIVSVAPCVSWVKRRLGRNVRLWREADVDKLQLRCTRNSYCGQASFKSMGYSFSYRRLRRNRISARRSLRLR